MGAERLGRLHNGRRRQRQDEGCRPYESAPDWWQDWRGETCVIIAGGPSAAEADLAEAQGKARFIAINNSWQLAPWADVLYACDRAWWKAHSGVPTFTGLKISQDSSDPQWGVKRIRVEKGQDRLLVGQLGTVGWGGNGGFHALNLAVQFGAVKIILVGYDMRIDKGMHWHGKHGAGLNNPTAPNVERWRRVVDGAAAAIAAVGVKVINTSPVSALVSYPKMSLSEALAC